MEPIVYCLACKDQEELTSSDYFMMVFSLLISFYAGFLSWNCNKNLEFVSRSIYAFFAFIFGFTYILLFLIFRFEECSFVNK